jgi:hypothetical protein
MVWGGIVFDPWRRNMLVMYRGFEIVPVKTGEMWRAQISSSGRRVAVTPAHRGDEPAMSEARRIVDGIRNPRTAANWERTPNSAL